MTERQPGSDPIGELQRWLVRSGARSVTRQLGDQVRTALGGSTTHGDVWENATADHEAPECQWCPICRARRRLRESGPGLSSSLAAAGDAVSVVLQDAAAAFEAAVAAAARQARPRDEAPASGTVWDEATGAPASGTVRDEATGAPARPLPRIVPDPPAGTAGASGAAEPGGAAGTAEPAGGAEREEPAGPADPPTGPATTGPGPAGPAGPAE
ncbi:MAG TPA: hypothetical protein VF933_10780 [Streptosporangiaceae bacterium]